MSLSRPTSTEWKWGDTFLHDRDRWEHLQVVLSDPAVNPSKIVFVNFSSQPYHERTCVIEPGEHPYVKKQTYIPYQFAYVLPLAYLEEAESSGRLRKQAPLSSTLLQRAIFGASRSRRMATEIWDIIEGQDLLPI